MDKHLIERRPLYLITRNRGNISLAILFAVPMGKYQTIKDGGDLLVNRHMLR